MCTCTYRHTGKLAKQVVKKGYVKVSIKLSKSERRRSVVWKKTVGSGNKRRHLHKIQSRVGLVKNRGRNYKEDVIMSRLKLGRSNLNSTLYIIGKHPAVYCDQCQEIETVEQVVITCRRYEVRRQEMFADLHRWGLLEAGVKSTLECGGRGEGRRTRTTGLIKDCRNWAMRGIKSWRQ